MVKVEVVVKVESMAVGIANAINPTSHYCKYNIADSIVNGDGGSYDQLG